MRSVTRFATLLFATAALAACEDKADFSNILVPITPVTSIGGTFTLQTLNGLPLPQPIGGGINVTASSLILVAANSTSGTFTLNVTTDQGGGTTTTATGNYTLNGQVLSLVTTNPAGVPTLTGTWDGANTLTLTEFGTTAVYTRP
jgi:hypothetical protein